VQPAVNSRSIAVVRIVFISGLFNHVFEKCQADPVFASVNLVMRG